MDLRIIITSGRPWRAMRPARPKGNVQAHLWVRSVAGLVVMAVLIFLSAGRLDYWQGWVFFMANAVILGVTISILRDDPELMEERLKPGKGIKRWDKLYYFLSTPLYLLAIVLAAMDAGRFHWSRPIQPALYAFCFVVFVLGHALFLWAKRVNSFFSSVVRIQTDRGQTVCEEGPYRFIRHPGYLSGLLFGMATPVLLGSSWALIPQAMAAALLLVRTCLEDRTLQDELPGYEGYARRTRFRLVPRVW